MHDYCQPAGTKKLRFRDWLKQKLDNKEVEGVEWIDRSKGVFKIPWTHGSRRGWCLRIDSEIFRQWAVYSGKYKEGEKPDPSKWKTNFRCTLNALPDFREVREKSSPRGPKAYKIYAMKGKDLKLLKDEKKASEEKPTKQTCEQRQGAFNLTDKEIVELVDDMLKRTHSNQIQSVVLSRPNSAFPAFETLVIDRSRETFSNYSVQATHWYLAAWNAMAVDKFVQKPATETEKNNDKGNSKKPPDGEIRKDETQE